MNHENHRVAKGKRIKSNLIFFIKKIKNQKKWTKEEDELLITLAEKYSEKNWKEISKRFLKKNSLQCFSRYKRIRPGIIKGSWKKEEDLRIIELVMKHGKAWSKISKILGTRNGKQIRDRYINVLDPEIKKGKFTDDEDNKLVLLFKQHGPKWATIAKYYPNRTADMIKNRFHSSIKKKLTGEDDGSDKNLKDDLLSIQHESSIMSEETKASKTVTKSPNSLRESLSRKLSDDIVIADSSPNEFLFKDSNINNFHFNSHNLATSSAMIAKETEVDFFMQGGNIFNYDFLNYEKEVKVEEPMYGNDAFNWNLEDYFTI